MDKLKDFIEKNHSAFDDEQMPDGHLERFENKLPPSKKTEHTIQFSLYTLIVAASIALLFLFRIPGTLLNTDGDKSDKYVCETKQEMQTLCIYYQMQMNEMIEKIEFLSKNEEIPGAEFILSESKRLIFVSEQFEDKVLPSLPCSEEGVFAVNQHYTTSLESLNRMLQFILYTH